jgi:hypothetical protein
MLMMKYATPDEKQILIEDNKKQYELEKSVEGDPDDIFSW